MTRNFSQLYDKLSPAARKRTEKWVVKQRASLALKELREAQKMTQTEMAAKLKVNQAAISKFEGRSDMYMSTLYKFVGAMGGKLEMNAVFPSGSVKILLCDGRAGSSTRKAKRKTSR